MIGQTTQQEGQADGPRQPEPPADQEEATEAERLLGEAFRRELDQVIQPIVENIRKISQGADNRSGGHEESKQPPPQGQNQAPVLTLTLDRRQAEYGLQAILDHLLDAIFSDALQTTMQQRAEQTIRSLVEVTRKSVPKKQPLDETQQCLQILDDTLAELFAESSRAEVQKSGQEIIGHLLRWDGPSAQRQGERALQSLAEQRLGAFQTIYEQVLLTLLEVNRRASQQNTKAAASHGAASLSSKDANGADLPQTIVRSDERAQDIWTKARDKAAEKDGAGRAAERAGYDALKRQYEKKGDRWVKKTTQAKTRESGNHTRHTASK